MRNIRVDKDGEKPKKRGKYNHFKSIRHCVKKYPKLKKKEAMKKESSMVVANTSFVRIDSTNLEHDADSCAMLL